MSERTKQLRKQIRYGASARPAFAHYHLAASSPASRGGLLPPPEVIAQWLQIFEKLVELRSELLSAPLPEGSAKEKITALLLRREILKQLDVEIGRVLFVLLRFVPPKLSRKRTKALKCIAIFIQTIIRIARKGRIFLKELENWLEEFKEYLRFKSKMLQVFKEWHHLQKILKSKELLGSPFNKSPPEHPADCVFNISLVWISIAAPRVGNAPPFPCCLSERGAGCSLLVV